MTSQARVHIKPQSRPDRNLKAKGLRWFSCDNKCKVPPGKAEDSGAGRRGSLNEGFEARRDGSVSQRT
jgi:hypothetical protein